MPSTFTYGPDFGAQVNKQPAVKRVKFGDGYEQRIQFGINNNPQVWSLTFKNRDASEATAIDAFLADKAAVYAFYWTPPGSTTQIAVVCDSWSMEAVKYNLYTVTATFRQVFQP